MHRLLALALIAPFALVVLPSCSSSSSDPAPAPGGSANKVTVGGSGLTFTPSTLTIKAGQTVEWDWASSGHSVTSGDSTKCTADGKFDSTVKSSGFTFTQTFATPGTFTYFCTPHCGAGMKGTITVTN